MSCVIHSSAGEEVDLVLRCSAGTARQIRKTPIAAISTVIKIADPVASEPKIRSPGRTTVLCVRSEVSVWS